MLNQKKITLLSTTREIEVHENSWDRVRILNSKDAADIYSIFMVMGPQLGYTEERLAELKKAWDNSYGYDLES